MKKSNKILNNLNEALKNSPTKAVTKIKPKLYEIYTYMNTSNLLLVKAVDNSGVWIQSLLQKGKKGQGFWTYEDWIEDYKKGNIKVFEGTTAIPKDLKINSIKVYLKSDEIINK